MSGYRYDSDFDVDVADRWREEADARRDAMRDELRAQPDRTGQPGWFPTREERDAVRGDVQ